MNIVNGSTLELKNDMFFMKLIKQAPVYTIMTLHQRIKDVVPLSEKYSVIGEMINRQFNTNFSLAFIQQQI